MRDLLEFFWEKASAALLQQKAVARVHHVGEPRRVSLQSTLNAAPRRSLIAENNIFSMKIMKHANCQALGVWFAIAEFQQLKTKA